MFVALSHTVAPGRRVGRVPLLVLTGLAIAALIIAIVSFGAAGVVMFAAGVVVALVDVPSPRHRQRR